MMNIILKRTLFVLLAALWMHGALHAQEVSDNFFSIDEPFELNMPTVGLSLKLPARMGMKATVLGDKDGFLDMQDNQFNYSFSNNLLAQGRVAFFFAPSGSEEIPPLLLQLAPELIDDPEGYLKLIPHYSAMLPNIPSVAGTFIGAEYKVEVNMEGSDSASIHTIRLYLLPKDLMTVVFTIQSEQPDVLKQSQEIIESFNEKLMPEALQKYRQRCAELPEEEVDGEDESKQENTVASSSADELTEFKGKLDASSTFNYKSLGFQFQMPEKFKYELNARDVVLEGNQVEIVLSEDDFKSSSRVSSNFYNGSVDGLFVMLSLESDSIAKDWLDSFANNQKVIKHFNFRIDGVLFEAVAVGPKDFPSVYLVGNLNGFGLDVRLMDIRKESLSLADRIVKSMVFANKCKKGLTGKKNTYESIGKFVPIEEFKMEPIEAITFTGSKKPASNLSTYSFVDEKFTCSLPRSSSPYVNPENAMEELSSSKYQLKRSDAEKEESMSITLMDSRTITISTVKASGSLKDDFDVIRKRWSTYNNIEVKRSGIGMVNGKEWALLEYEQLGERTYWFMTEHNGYSINLMCRSSEPDKEFYEQLLYLFKFN